MSCRRSCAVELKRVNLLQTVIAILLLNFATAGSAQAQSFSDDFEAPAIDAFWSLQQQNGSIQLSTDVSHSGVQAVKLTATGGGQVNVWLTHTFPQATKGTLSTWFYDTAPGIYSGLYGFDFGPGNYQFHVNAADWNPSFYIWGGPGVSEAPTAVARTVGWHQFTLQVTGSGFNALIDQNIVAAVAGDFTFNEVRLLVSGPSETGTFYFDDFTFTPLLTVPTTKEECKDGGWMSLVRADSSSFRNQGACVSYVNTGK